MIPTLTGLFRGTIFLSLAACVAAIGLGRSAPRPTEYQVLTASRCSAVAGQHFSTEEHVPRLLDLDSGQVGRVAFPAGDHLESAVCSPWQDGDGTSVVVGRWIDRSGSPGVCGEFGVARFTVPEGRARDRVPLDVIPTSRPCFFPKSHSRILFTSGDGRLYRFSFERGRDGSPAGDDESVPREVRWRMDVPGGGVVMIADPVWPTDPRFGGRLLVVLTYLDATAVRRAFRPSELWCLTLSRDGAEIVAGRRLIRPGLPLPGPGDSEERMPGVSATPDGGLALAYLARVQGRTGLQMRLAPIVVEPETGSPVVDATKVVALADHCPPHPPAFSPDGRWLFGLIPPNATDARVARFSVGEALQHPSTVVAGNASSRRRVLWQ